jgi:hypothetical protein
MQVICPVFVDNITFASKSKAKIAELKATIAKHIKPHNLGPTTFQIGIKIIRNCRARTLHLLQHHYCLDLLEHYGFTNCSPVYKSHNPSVCLSTAQAPQTPEKIVFMCTVPYVRFPRTLPVQPTSGQNMCASSALPNRESSRIARQRHHHPASPGFALPIYQGLASVPSLPIVSFPLPTCIDTLAHHV